MKDLNLKVALKTLTGINDIFFENGGYIWIESCGCYSYECNVRCNSSNDAIIVQISSVLFQNFEIRIENKKSLKKVIRKIIKKLNAYETRREILKNEIDRILNLLEV